eukprot:2730957-Alexandrium_andersonii.AAC.1
MLANASCIRIEVLCSSRDRAGGGLHLLVEAARVNNKVRGPVRARVRSVWAAGVPSRIRRT